MTDYSIMDPELLPISLALMVERNIRAEIGCNEYIRGAPSGKHTSAGWPCESNGHYLCRECRCLRLPEEQ